MSEPIENLDLPVKTYNCLKRAGIHTTDDLVGCTWRDLLDLRNFGVGSLSQVEVALNVRNLRLKVVER